MTQYRVFINENNEETANSIVVKAVTENEACVKAIEYFESKGIKVETFEAYKF